MRTIIIPTITTTTTAAATTTTTTTTTTTINTNININTNTNTTSTSASTSTSPDIKDRVRALLPAIATRVIGGNEALGRQHYQCYYYKYY